MDSYYLLKSDKIRHNVPGLNNLKFTDWLCDCCLNISEPNWTSWFFSAPLLTLSQVLLISTTQGPPQISLSSVQFSSVTQLCPTLRNPMNRRTPGLPVHHQLPEFIQTHVHRVGDDIQPSHPLSSPFPSAPNPSQHQGLLQVSSSHEVAKVLEFQLQHQSFQWTPRTDLL